MTDDPNTQPLRKDRRAAWKKDGGDWFTHKVRQTPSMQTFYLGVENGEAKTTTLQTNAYIPWGSGKNLNFLKAMKLFERNMAMQKREGYTLGSKGN